MMIGIDYASVDRNDPPDFQAAKKAGVRFVIVRGAYGTTIDATWARDKGAIKAAGLKRTAYLFLCFPQVSEAAPTPEQQANDFANYVKLDTFSDYPPMLDVEQASNALKPAEMYDWVLRATTTLRAHYGVWPGIYTSARVWAENLNHHSPGPLLNCPLWLAKPWPWAVGTPIHLDGAPMYSPTLIPEFSDQWWLYQYQGDAARCPGFSSTVDASRFHMLRRGDTGTTVAWAQHRLGVYADGIFGPDTENAVQALQRGYGLMDDGIIGPDTFAPLSWSNQG